jgi:hypothetical protein
MKKLFLFFFLLLSSMVLRLHAQDTLPKFTVTNAGNNRIIIGWTNTFESIKQISIQRSFDSLKNYKTILTVPDPTTRQNGYVDAKATNDHMFYRIYIMLDKGVYLFSDAKRPVIDTLKRVAYTDKINKMNGQDSVAVPSFGLNNGTKPVVFTPSLHVYTFKDGYVRVNLPDDEEKKYSIKFFDEDENFLFELKDIKERTFKIDKANFYHAGWFKFELYEDGKLKEKHKFYLQKDF